MALPMETAIFPSAPGGKPPNFTVLEKSLCEACLSRHGRDAKGQKQHS